MTVIETTENGVTFNCSDATTGYVIIYNTTEGWGRIYEAENGKIQSKDSMEEIATYQGAVDRLNELGVTIIEQ